MKRHCVIFATSRAIRDASSLTKQSFLPTMLTMSDFLDRTSLYNGLSAPDDDLRVIALHKAADFSSFNTLNIERNFFTFIQNSSYIFRLFEELSAEQVSLVSLMNNDIYGDYEEHLSILSHLYQRYKALVKQYRWKDPIFYKRSIEINEGFIRQFDSISIHIEGYLSRYEMDILKRCSELTTVICHYNASDFNEKMTERLRGLGLELLPHNDYRFSLTHREILEQIPIQQPLSLECEVMQERLAQVGFVKAKVYQMVHEGIDPKSIVVVVPDESFIRYLKLFDAEKNFNFAMGFSMRHEESLKQIEAIELYLQEQSAENKARIRKIDHDTVEWFRSHYEASFCVGDLEYLASIMAELACKKEEKEIILDEMNRFKSIAEAFNDQPFKAGLRIFLNRLKERSIDDVSGGKITVMGLLETRGVSFDGVIVVDFNEGFVPHISQKDLFLNTQTRSMADLPTASDREGLQKHYYWMLFNRAKKVAISCVENSETLPSRFLMQLGIAKRPAGYDYSSILISKAEFRERQDQRIETEYDFTKHPLSSSRLKSFLTCKRQFYYKYIAQIKEFEKPRDLSSEREIGNRLHGALEQVYASRDSYDSKEEIKKGLAQALKHYEVQDAMQRYVQTLWIEKLEPFYENETDRFSDGVRVLHREKEGSCSVHGIELVGRIDRIDQTPLGLEILDYKTGKYPSTQNEPKPSDTDYQLPIYALLSASFGTVHRCGFYDLNSGRIEFEKHLDAKIEQLHCILEELTQQKHWIWEKCETLSPCRYCPYAILCQRELT